MVYKEVYIIRHSESDANKDGINLGENAELTEEGRVDALRLAKRVTGMMPIDIIISSPIKTALQTANIISKTINTKVEVNNLFIQRKRPSCLIGKKHTDLDAKQINDILFWNSENIEYRHSDEENLMDMKERMSKVLNYLQNHTAKNICVVTHGTVLWGIFWAIFSDGKYSGKDFQKILLSLEIDNNSITNIRYEDPNTFMPDGYGSKWKIISWNNTVSTKKNRTV